MPEAGLGGPPDDHDHGDIEEGEEENGNEEEADEGDLVDRVPLQDHLSF